MRLLDRSGFHELLQFASSITSDLPHWSLVDIALDEKAAYNSMVLARKLEDALPGRTGVIYVHDRTHLLALVRQSELAKDCAREFATYLCQTVLAFSCDVVSMELTPQGLSALQLRLAESENGSASFQSTLYTERADREENVILIAAHDQQIRSLLRETLARVGTCITVGDPGAILDAYLEHVPDMVLLDIDFPGAPQMDTVKTLMKYDASAYVVVLTSSSTAGNALSAKHRGAKGFIAKPFSLSRLYHEIARCPTIRRFTYPHGTRAFEYFPLPSSAHNPKPGREPPHATPSP